MEEEGSDAEGRRCLVADRAIFFFLYAAIDRSKRKREDLDRRFRNLGEEFERFFKLIDGSFQTWSRRKHLSFASFTFLFRFDRGTRPCHGKSRGRSFFLFDGDGGPSLPFRMNLSRLLPWLTNGCLKHQWSTFTSDQLIQNRPGPAQFGVLIHGLGLT